MVTKTVKREILGVKVKAFIVQTIREILDDPDLGLELSEKAKKRLRQVSSSNQKTVPFSEIRIKYY